ncbi:hypothetical protein F4778DRAFT_576270 [Xylariomycetidae sp. FL2044]|nr:hypothetical protein F4778DRAFT_576270 [Xylariomycetidae sp. FL2044]
MRAYGGFNFVSIDFEKADDKSHRITEVGITILRSGIIELQDHNSLSYVTNHLEVHHLVVAEFADYDASTCLSGHHRFVPHVGNPRGAAAALTRTVPRGELHSEISKTLQHLDDNTVILYWDCTLEVKLFRELGLTHEMRSFDHLDAQCAELLGRGGVRWRASSAIEWIGLKTNLPALLPDQVPVALCHNSSNDSVFTMVIYLKMWFRDMGWETDVNMTELFSREIHDANQEFFERIVRQG